MDQPGTFGCARRAALTVALLVTLSAARAGAQSRAAALVLEAPAGSAAFAFGNAALLDGADPSLLFYNPAWLGRTSGTAVAIQRYGSRAILGSLAAATGWGSGGVGVGVQTLAFGALAGLPARRDAQSALLLDGPQGVTELVATIGYGREILGIRVGVAGKVIEERVAGQRDGSIMADIGVAYDAGDVVFAVVGRNLGPDLTIGSRAAELPRLVSAMITLEEQWVGPLDVALTTALTMRRDDELIPAGGIQVSYWPVTGRTFTLRAGLQRVAGDARSPFTLGAAVTLDAFMLEWAFQSFEAPGDSHRFGIRWR